MSTLELGDIGTVSGQDGHWVLYAGAPNPPNIEPVGAASIAAAVPSDTLTVYNWAGVMLQCPRDAFRPLHTNRVTYGN